MITDRSLLPSHVVEMDLDIKQLEQCKHKIEETFKVITNFYNYIGHGKSRTTWSHAGNSMHVVHVFC